ncbi:MAG: methyltransferase [Syntrophomonas sp.]
MENQAIKVFQPQVEGTDLLGLIRGYRQSIFLYQAFKTGVFEYLTAKPQNIEAIAGKMGCHADRMAVFLNALIALDLAAKEGDQYRVTPLGYTYLCRSSRFFLGDLMDLEFSAEQGSTWAMMGPWLKGGAKEENHIPEAVFHASFVRAMAQGVLSDNGVAHTVELISRHPCFAEARNVLDLGGGHGLFPIALQQKKTGLNITIFDLPQVEEVNREYAQVFGGKVDFQPGNFYTDELPGDQDIILAFDILHPVAPAQKEEVFGRVYRALRTAGHLFYKIWFLDESRTKPPRAALFALKCKVTTGDSHVYTCREATEMLERIGFEVEDIQPVGDGYSTMLVAVKHK